MTTTVTLNPEQEEIRGVARSFLQSRFPSDRVRELMATEDGFDRSGWEEVAELGWLGIAVPEELGGAGYTTIERCLLLEEMGRVLYPGPFLSSAVLAADALVLAGDGGEAATQLLAGIVDGSIRATLVASGDLLGGESAAAGIAAAGGEGGFELSGNGGLVVDGASAQQLLVIAAAEDGVGLFAVDPAGDGVERHPAPLVDETRKTAVVELDRAVGRRLDAGQGTEEAIALVLRRGAIALAAEAVGGAQQAIEMTVAYMNEREQFGRQIGTFQALKHRLADMFVMIDAAREAVYSAADVVEGGELGPLPMAAAAAKAAASEGFVHTTAEAVQLHGGIGFTEEHDIGLYYKRALAMAPALGTGLGHRELIAAGLGV